MTIFKGRHIRINWLKIIGIIFLLCIIVGEVILRMYGFCNAPLYYNNEYTNYNLVPNQDVVRFGNVYKTNEYSMRSDSLGENEFRIALIGDSVLNGGVNTDQSDLATSKLEQHFQDIYSDAIRVLNISCGHWGIDNDAGVIKEYGDFDSSLFVLVLNSHDAVTTLSNQQIAGVDKSFPTEQYPLAWIELFDRYLIPKIKPELGINTSDNLLNTGEELYYCEGWTFFRDYCNENNIELMIYLHATVYEINEGEYDANGQWIIEFANENNIPLFMDIDVAAMDDYRDYIHLNSDGQHVIYDVLEPTLNEFISNNY